MGRAAGKRRRKYELLSQREIDRAFQASRKRHQQSTVGKRRRRASKKSNDTDRRAKP
jgi:hypothetical protein